MKTIRRYRTALVIGILAVAAISLRAGVVEVVHPEFLNELTNGMNLPADKSSSVAFHNGTIGPYSAPVNPLRGQFLLFDGVDDYVQSQQDIDLANRSFSIEAWAQRRSSDTMDMIVGQGGAGSHRSLHFGFHSIAGNQFVLGFYDNDLFSGTSYTDDAWHHWAGTYDATSGVRCLYQDGVLIASNTAPQPYQGSGPLYIGMTPFGGFGDVFDGSIDEVRIWHVARTAEQIQENMLRTLAGTEEGLVACWPFDEGTGSTAADATGHGYTGSLYNGAAWFPGPAIVPSDGSRQLAESSFGQAFATDFPYPNFALDSISNAQAMLYATNGMPRAALEASDLVFRYKVLLFNTNSGGVAADPSQMENYFGNADRQKFREAVKLMRDALKYVPYDTTLRNTLLDAYYDLAVAEAQFAKLDRAKIAEYRLGLRVVPLTDFVIDYEIGLMTNLVARYENALSRFGELLTDRMGVDVSEYDPAVTNGMPLGAYIFQQEQPVRSQYAAQFCDADGILKTVPQYDPGSGQTTNNPDRVLFAGYKDYVNLLGLLREYTVSGAELARLYGMRGRRAPTDDIQEAYNLVNKIQSEAQLEVLLLQGLFTSYEPAPGDASGLRAALNGLGVGLAELDNVRAFLDGKRNLLGFDPNFLVLIKEAPEGETRADSYDALMYWIGARGAHSIATPLGTAEDAFLAAYASYDTYRGNADEVQEQLSLIANTYNDRYYQITGWDPGDTSTNHFLAPKPGSELWQAHQNVELADYRVANMTNQMEKISEVIKQAERVVTLANGKSDWLEAEKQYYFDQTASTWENLHGWKGEMAFAQATYDMVSDLSSVDGISTLASAGGDLAAISIAGVANISLQTAGAVEVSKAEQDLEQAAADYEVALMQVDIPAEIAQAQIEYHDRMREQIALTLEMKDARATQAQEVARRQNLLRELEHIKQQAEESDASLADRYYADPIHYLRAQNNMILADQAFSEAQRWIFFTVRALEFKFNTNFVKSWLGKDWELASLFKLRNYTELEQMVGAMEDFNRINLLGFNREPFVDVISLREDIMATPAGRGTDGLWLDVATGERVSSTNLLRRKLQRSLVVEGDQEYLEISLNTFALKKTSGFFFVGPRYRTNGTVLSAGKYLDKIEWLKFNVVGSLTPATRDANLSYGGTCYIRTRMPPCGNLADPFTLPGEYRAFPFFYFRTLDNGVTWETLKTQADTVKVAFTHTPGVEPPGETMENRFLKERSVAATDWVLTLFVRNGATTFFNINQVDDIEIWVRHQYVSRELPSCTP